MKIIAQGIIVVLLTLIGFWPAYSRAQSVSQPSLPIIDTEAWAGDPELTLPSNQTTR